jgi:hypothetical protein
MLLLDGLDEVSPTRRAACVQALNEFIQLHGTTEIVVTTRIKDYEVLDHAPPVSGRFVHPTAHLRTSPSLSC